MSEDPLNDLDGEQRTLALRLRTTLRDAEHVDAATAARLARARSEAVSRSLRTGSRSALLWVTSSAAVLVLVGVLTLKPPSSDSSEASAADALEVMTDDLDADFYEDLDLYRWLEAGNV